MKKLIMMVCAAVVAAVQAEVTSSGHNHEVTGSEGNTLAIAGDAEAQVTLGENAAVTITASADAAVIMKEGGAVTLDGESNSTRLFGSGTVTVGSGAATIGGKFNGTVTVAEGATATFAVSKAIPTAPAKADDATYKSGRNMLWFDPSQNYSYGTPDSEYAATKYLKLLNLAKTDWYPLCGEVRSAVVVNNAMANGSEMPWLYYCAKLGGYEQPECEGYRGLMMRFVNGSSGEGNTFDTRTGFMVMDTTKGGGSFLMDTTVGTSYYLNTRANADSHIFIPKAGHEGLAGSTSPTYLNGVSVDSSAHTFNNRGEVLSFCFNEAVPIKNINYYLRCNESFHTRHGEVLFYKSELTADERQDTEAYLMNKWFGLTPTGYGDLSQVTVDGAGAVVIDGAYRPNFAASYTGSVSIESTEFTYEDGAIANKFEFDGPLTVAEGATIKVNFADDPSYSGKLVLATANALTLGENVTVTVTASDLIEFQTATLAVEDNQLVLNYQLADNLFWKVSNVPSAVQSVAVRADLVTIKGNELATLDTVALDTLTTTPISSEYSDCTFQIRLYNSNGIAVGVSEYTYEQIMASVSSGPAAAIVPTEYATYASGLYTLPCAAWDDQGMTFNQQLTNAVKLAANGATIQILPGTYELGTDYMRTDTVTSGSNTDTINTYVEGSKRLNFVGDTTGHWSDRVVLKGNKTARFYVCPGATSADNTIFSGITFENFQAGSTLVNVVGNTDWRIIGGAISTTRGMSATNCVFKSNKARSGGAVAQSITCRDCKFLENTCAYNGGAAYLCSFYGCRFENNSSASGSGAIWWPVALDGCDFIGNHAGSNGAVHTQENKVFSNCRFYNNYSTFTGDDACSAIYAREGCVFSNMVFVGNYANRRGGAVWADLGCSANPNKVAKIIDCVFSNNYAVLQNDTSEGGAIWAASSSGAKWPPQIIGCKFVGNHAIKGGGAVYGSAFITNCVFEANYAGNYNNSNYGYSSSARARGGAVLGVGIGSNALNIVNSAFVSNYINVAQYCCGAAIAQEAAFGAISARCDRCVFYGNYLLNKSSTDSFEGKIVHFNRNSKTGNDYRLIDCAFTNNFVCTGGLVNESTIINCIFSGNEVPSRGACAVDCRVYDTLFTNNRKWDLLYPDTVAKSGGAVNPDGTGAGVDALNSKLYHCDMDGGVYTGCSIDGCVIRDCASVGTYCTFTYGNYVTNTLIAGVVATNESMRAMIYRWGNTGSRSTRSPFYNEFVNCTFADNLYRGGAETWTYLMSCGYPQSSTNRTFETFFLNCAFNNNRWYNRGDKTVQGVRDLCAAVNGDADVEDSAYAKILMVSNCVFGVAPGIWVSNQSKTLGYTDLGGNQVVSAAAQRLVKSEADMARYQCSVKYTPKGHSPLRDAGDASFYAEDAKDAAGNVRVNSSGKVDIGCYQSYLPRYGTLIFAK